MKGSIYLIRNSANGHGYVGQTRGSIENRLKKHISESRQGSECYLHRAMRKYGAHQFSISLIAEVEEYLLDSTECHFIEYYETFAPFGKGYNMTKGGDSAPRMQRSKEHARKISESLKGKKASEETKEKLRKSRANSEYKWTFSQEAREKARAANTGRLWTQEQRLRKAEQMRGNKNLLGHCHTGESRQKMSKKKKGVPHSPEHTAAVRASLLATLESRRMIQ